MANDNPGILGSARSLASAWTEAKTAELKHRAHTLQTRLDSPESWAETFGSTDATDRWQDRQAKRDELETYHSIRVDGGIVASLLEARSLMVFGVGGQFVDEVEDTASPANWLNNAFADQDLLTLDIGTDALFYGYALGETRETNGGEFGRIELVQPWTTVPKVSNKGEVLAWEQSVGKYAGREHTQEFDPDDVYHFNAMKASGRDPVGMSMLGRAMDEAQAYKDNQEAIQNAVTMHGFPKWHIKLGREDGAVIDDNELRRARPMFDDVTEVTKWLTGQDVDIDVISPESFEFEGITEHDLSKLAIAFMLPVELTQLGGGDGLGTGFPAKLRERLFLLSANAQQRSLAADLVGMAHTLLNEYSEFSEQAIDDANIDYQFEEPITDIEELQTKINAVGPDMTVNERREAFGMAPLDDETIGEDFDSPGQDAEAGAFGGPELQDGRDNLPSQTLRWLTDFAKADGSVDDPVADWLTWMAEFDDEPSTKVNRARVAVSLFAADQGIDFEQALEQPASNLVRFLERNRNLADNGPSVATLLSELDIYHSGFESIVWGEYDGDVDLAQPAFANDDDVPANVVNRLERAADQVNWDDIQGVPPGNARDYFVRKLSQPQGWSVDSLSNGLLREFGAYEGEPNERVNAVRTKSASLLNQSKRMAFEDLEDGIDGQLLYFWDGPDDENNTEACIEFRQATNPEYGGTPRPWDEFQSLMADIRQDHFPDFESNGPALHWQERHEIDAMLPSQADVNPAGVGGMATAAGDD